MTEYEMAYLQNEYVSSLALYGSGTFTTVTAFLVAAHIASHRLSLFMVVTVIYAYTVWLWGGVFLLSRVLSNLAGLLSKMHALAESGQGLEWHVAANPVSAWVPGAIQAFVFSNTTIIYVASIAFFLYNRRAHQKVSQSGWRKDD